MLGDEGAHVVGGNGCAGLLVGQRRHAGGHHELDVDGCAAAVLDHELKAVGTGNVADLVAVGDGGGGAAGGCHTCVLGRADVRRLDVQVPVDKAGSKVAPLAVDNLLGLVAAAFALEEHAHDNAIAYGYFARYNAQAVYVDYLSVGEQEVDGLAACRRVHDLLQGFNGHRGTSFPLVASAVGISSQNSLSQVYPVARRRGSKLGSVQFDVERNLRGFILIGLLKTR